MCQMETQQRGGTAGRLALVVAPPRHRRPRGRSVQMHTGENTCMHQTLHGNADQSNGRLSKQASERRRPCDKGPTFGVFIGDEGESGECRRCQASLGHAGVARSRNEDV